MPREMARCLQNELMNSSVGEIQELLGQKNIERTMIYTHVLRNLSKAPRSPLDRTYTNNRS
jgi:integrase